VRQVVDYLQREIRQERRNVGAMKLSNLGIFRQLSDFVWTGYPPEEPDSKCTILTAGKSGRQSTVSV